MSIASNPWFALLAAVGTGTIVGASVGAFVGRWVTISNLRQHWIDALREDLASYFTAIEALHFESIDTKKLEEEKAAKLVYWRILLRLNRKEELHIELAQKLHQLLPQEKRSTEIDDAYDLSRQILKQEWEVVKHGWFTNLVATFKQVYRVGSVD